MCKWQVSLTSPYNTPLLPAKQTIRISVSYTENDQKFSTLPIAINAWCFHLLWKGVWKLHLWPNLLLKFTKLQKMSDMNLCTSVQVQWDISCIFQTLQFPYHAFKSREENWTKRICSVSRKENRQIHAQKVVKTVEDFGASNLIEQLVALLNPFIFVCYSDLL